MPCPACGSSAWHRVSKSTIKIIGGRRRSVTVYFWDCHACGHYQADGGWCIYYSLPAFSLSGGIFPDIRKSVLHALSQLLQPGTNNLLVNDDSITIKFIGWRRAICQAVMGAYYALFTVIGEECVRNTLAVTTLEARSILPAYHPLWMLRAFARACMVSLCRLALVVSDKDDLRALLEMRAYERFVQPYHQTSPTCSIGRENFISHARAQGRSHINKVAGLPLTSIVCMYLRFIQ